MSVPVEGQTGTCASGVNKPEPNSDSFTNRLIGSSNEHFVIIDGHKLIALIDSGSQVTTMSFTCFKQISKVELQSLDCLGIDLSVADGSPMKFLGYFEAEVEVPFISDFTLTIPILVVPDNELNKVIETHKGNFN